MGKIIDFPAPVVQPDEAMDGALDVSRAAADHFPNLAGQIEAAMDHIAALSEKKQRLILGSMARHFLAMENVLALLREQNHPLYRPTLESYLTLQLKAITRKLAVKKIIKLYRVM